MIVVTLLYSWSSVGFFARVFVRALVSESPRRSFTPIDKRIVYRYRLMFCCHSFLLKVFCRLDNLHNGRLQRK